MPTVMSTGDLRLPVRYRSWDEWRDDRSSAADATVAFDAPGCFCAACWGQGRVLSSSPNGEGLIPSPCRVCAATGRAPGD